MNSRERVLARIRSANARVGMGPASPPVTSSWAYAQPTAMPDVLARFVERVEDYRADVRRCAADGLPAAVAAGILAAGATSVVLPDGAPPEWAEALTTAGVTVRREPLRHDELDGIGAVVTGCAVGIAETGTIVLDHSADQGRRAVTLVPDVHVCVVWAEQVVSDVPEAVAAVSGSLRAGRPLTWISGPSATSDIELSRVEGVHGPRTLRVLLVEPADPKT